VGSAARNARPVADPLFTAGVPLEGAPGSDPVLDLLVTWTPSDAERQRRRPDEAANTGRIQRLARSPN